MSPRVCVASCVSKVCEPEKASLRRLCSSEKTIAAAMLSLCGCAAEERAQRSDDHDTEAMRSERIGCTAREAWTESRDGCGTARLHRVSG